MYLRAAAAISVLLFLLLSAFYVLSDYFTGEGLNEAVIFHLRYGLAGAGFKEYIFLIVVTAVFLILAAGVSGVIFIVLRHRPGLSAHKLRFTANILLAAAIIINPASQNLLHLFSKPLYYRWMHDSSGGVGRYVIPEGLTPTSAPRNLVFIYLEGLERTYLDERIFPGLTPGLTSLARQSLDFTNIHQVTGTEWTIAGITASQCGIPLFTPSGGNSMSGMPDFLGGAVCMGDLLRLQGYDLTYLGGAPLEFAGKGKFFKTHGFNNVFGLDELLPELESTSYLHHWGLYDDSLFDMARKRFFELAGQPSPFGLFLLTVDTHHPRGYVSASCGAMPYKTGDNPMLNAVHCSDHLVTRFVKDILDSEHASDTLIVLASDHLGLPSTATPKLEQGDRRNLLLMINPDRLPAEKIERAGSQFDIAPTVLSLAGFDVAGLGYGRDLRRLQSSLMEELTDINTFLWLQRQFLMGLWDFPQLADGLRVDTNRQQVHLGERFIQIPALIMLNRQAGVHQILFESSSETLLHYVSDLNASEPFIWVDGCKQVNALVSKPALDETASICIAIGHLGGLQLFITPVTDDLFMAQSDVRQIIGNRFSDAATYTRRVQKLQSLLQFGIPAPHIAMDPLEELTGDLLVRLSGGFANPSFLRSAPQNGEEINGDIYLTRGMTLIGVTPDSEPVKLSHFDTCFPNDPVIDLVSSATPFAEVMDMSNQLYGAFVVVAHDSAVCDPTFDMQALLKDLPFQQWQELTVRQPYLGVIAGNGEVFELAGDVEETLTVVLTSFVAPRENASAN